MKIKGANNPGQVKAKLKSRLIPLQGYSTEKLDRAYGLLCQWLAKVDELQQPSDVCIDDVLDHFVSAKSPTEYAETLSNGEGRP